MFKAVSYFVLGAATMAAFISAMNTSEAVSDTRKMMFMPDIGGTYAPCLETGGTLCHFTADTTSGIIKILDLDRKMEIVSQDPGLRAFVFKKASRTSK